jgi:hypothetical protein
MPCLLPILLNLKRSGGRVKAKRACSNPPAPAVLI